MWPHIVVVETKNYAQPLVTENLLVIAEYRVGEARPELFEGFRAGLGWVDEGDAERIVGLDNPWDGQSKVRRRQRTLVTYGITYNLLAQSW